MAPHLIVTLADLEWNSATILDRVAAAYPPRRVAWSGNTLTLARTGFGPSILLRPAGAGVVEFAIDIADFDFGPDPRPEQRRRGERQWELYRNASIDLGDRVRPMLLVRDYEFGVEDLTGTGVSGQFGSGWACPDRMDERRANGFRRALAGVDHRVTSAGLAWSGAPNEVAEKLRLAWVRRPPDPPTRRHG